MNTIRTLRDGTIAGHHEGNLLCVCLYLASNHDYVRTLTMGRELMVRENRRQLHLCAMRVEA